MPKGENGRCTVEEKLTLLGGRFRAEILKALGAGEIHFNELRRVTGASAHTLTRTLRLLEQAGFLTSQREARWGRNLYALTAKGHEAVAIIDQLVQTFDLSAGADATGQGRPPHPLDERDWGVK
ncbi:winged helix-turn-helix transcriptional regulator [Pendulispora albinea]|uniref:Helix-turn-helix transcriptional regulator n=1 Tax=Pendulispora albinea TaxID=2741071 RepID=A0ABZ2LJU3_9BACT